MVDKNNLSGAVRVTILTASDRSARGDREDISGREIKRIALAEGWDVLSYTIVPDDQKLLEKELIRLADDLKANLVFTTGGTGLAPRDCTPEATIAVIEKVVPGLAEAMRMVSLKKTPHAMLSRAVCGVRGRTLIINLPGSPKAVRECLEVILPAIPHAVALLDGGVSDCARM